MQHAQRRGWRAASVFFAVVGFAGSSTSWAAAYPVPGVTERISAGIDGDDGNNYSFEPAISADGRYIAFSSAASNLVPDDTNNQPDIFVYDRATAETERVSVTSGGGQSNGPAEMPSISADGRVVVWESYASNLVPDDTTGPDVFVHDRATGTTERVSDAADGGRGNGISERAAVSADGRSVVFSSFASNLVPGDTNALSDIFVRDLATHTTERVSLASDGTQGNNHQLLPEISGDGRHVVWSTVASNLIPGDTNSAVDVFVHDRDTGVTELISVASDGTPGNDWSANPDISADGRFVGFQSRAVNLIPTDTNLADDVFVHDRATGRTERVSVASDGTESEIESRQPSLSADGRYVAFMNIVSTATTFSSGVFVHDRVTGITKLASETADGTASNGASDRPDLSADGRYVAFQSAASNLVADDGNGKNDVFLHDQGPSVGVGELSVVRESSELSITGWARFAGREVSSAADPTDDAASVGPLDAHDLGAELTGAGLIHRPEQGDLLLRLRMASLPFMTGPCAEGVCSGVSSGGGRPGILYGLRLRAGGVTYEVRILRAAAVAAPPAAPYMALFRCDPLCTEAGRLAGGIGTTGNEILVSIPLDAIGVAEGATLSDLLAFTAAGEATLGSQVTLDEAILPTAGLDERRLLLGIAPAGTPSHQVDFSSIAGLTGGGFVGALDVSSHPQGSHDVWARACLGEACGMTSRLVHTGSGPG